MALLLTDTAILTGWITAMTVSRQMDRTEYFLTGRGTSGGISIRQHAEDKDIGIVVFPRGVSTWDTDEPSESTAEDSAHGASVSPEKDDLGTAEREKECASTAVATSSGSSYADREKGPSSTDRPTARVGFLPSLQSQERTLDDRKNPTLVGEALIAVWFTDPTYRRNLEVEMLRALRNGVSDEELSLVRDAVSGKTDQINEEALKSALGRMQARFDTYKAPTIKDFNQLEHEEDAERFSLGSFRFRWDDLSKVPYQDSTDDSAADDDARSATGAGALSEQLIDHSVEAETEENLLQL